MSTQIRVSGLQATSGQRYVSIETDMAFATLRLEQFSLANPRLAADLAEAGLLFTSKKRQDVRDRLHPDVSHIGEIEVLEPEVHFPARQHDDLGYLDAVFGNTGRYDGDQLGNVLLRGNAHKLALPLDREPLQVGGKASSSTPASVILCA